MYEESVGIVETKYLNIEEPIELDSGEILNDVIILSKCEFINDIVVIFTV